MYFIFSLVSRYLALFLSLSLLFPLWHEAIQKNNIEAKVRKCIVGTKYQVLSVCCNGVSVSKIQLQFLPGVVKLRFWKREGKARPIFLLFFHRRFHWTLGLPLFLKDSSIDIGHTVHVSISKYNIRTVAKFH